MRKLVIGLSLLGLTGCSGVNKDALRQANDLIEQSKNVDCEQIRGFLANAQVLIQQQLNK